MDWNMMEYFDDQFDILDDDHDSADLTASELNRYFLEGHLNSMMDEEAMIEDVQFSDHNDLELPGDEEEILSQKLSQLSTEVEVIEDEEEEQASSVTNKKRRISATSNPDSSLKKMKMTMNDNDHDDNIDDSNQKQDQIPCYLLTTNESFIQLANKLIHNITNLISLNDLQEMALLIHQMAAVHIQKQVTMIYYKSGMGTLREPELELIPIDRRVWPEQVKSVMRARQSTSDTTTMSKHLDYEKLVHERLEEMNNKSEQYQKQFDEKKSQLIGFTSAMEETIRRYVFYYGIRSLKIKRDLKIALLKHDYDVEILERKFLQEQPNEYQIQIAKRLYETRNALEKSRRELLELKQRVYYNKPPVSYNSVQTTITIEMTNDNNQQAQLLLDKHEKIIQRKKLDLMAIEILKAEQNFHRCQKIFSDELSTMWQNHRNLVKDKGMPTALSNLIEQRLINITNRWRDIYYFRLHYHLENPYGDWDAKEEIMKKEASAMTTTAKKDDSNKQIMKIIGFQPRMIIDTTHSLTDKQLQLLNRGPTYVPPCQMHVSSTSLSSQSMADILKKQYAPLKHQLACLFTKHKVNVALQMRIQNEIYDKFKECFSMSVPPHIQHRTMYEMKLLQSICQSFKTNNLILRRTADNMNTFYLGNSQEFERKADEYLTKTDIYKIWFTLDEENDQQKLHREITNLVVSINHALGMLKRRSDIDENLYNRLLINATNVKLSYLYFLPDVSCKENDIVLIPMITSEHNITFKVSKYLDQLLRPFANDEMASVTFDDEIAFIQKLNAYASTDNRLTPITLFCTMNISNYATLDSHENMIQVVYNFIQTRIASNRLYKIPIMTIKNLLQLCLYNNIFCYKDKIYTFTKGGPTALPLLDTLSNIYLFVWQKMITDEIQRKNELFGRYKDQIFFTWNNTDDELRHLLHTTTQKYPHVHVQTFFGSDVQFLNAYIANHNGQLYTRVYHNPTIQAYTLPYVVGHSKVKHSDWIRSALLRAVCFCSSIDDFHQERIYIELTCLVNGYSHMFVESRVAHFYEYFRAVTLQYTTDQTVYDTCRHRWFNFMNMQRTLSNKLQKSHDNGSLIHLHYLYEFGSRCQFNKEFNKLWNEHFATDPILGKEKITILLTSQHLHSLNALLTQQLSFCWLSI